MTALGKLFLFAVLGFLYLPVAVLVAMAFNASPLYALPFEFTTHWFQELSGNDKLLAATRKGVYYA